jgi:hypothetical protein
MSFALWVHSLGGRSVGAWVQSYDPDGGDLAVSYPTGFVTLTQDPEQAITFETFEAASEFWRQASSRTPERPDGKPNRPLTAYTVSVMRLP